MSVIFPTFIAEAIIPALLFYSVLMWIRGPKGQSWGTHLVAIAAVCFTAAVIRLGAAGLFGGPFAMGYAVLWALVVPGGLSWAAVAILAGMARNEKRATRPETTSPQAHAAAAAVGQPPEAVPAPPQAPPPRPATPAAVFFMLGAVVGGGLVLIFVGLLWLVVMANPGQGDRGAGQPTGAEPRREIVDPFRAPPMQRGFGREADPAWRALRAEWEGRNQAWLQVPGAREALHQAILVEDAEGTATSYQELLARSVSRAQRELYAQQRRAQSRE